jgi:hypothetical protein
MHSDALAGKPYVLFWAVDFLGGLNNRSLHSLQLTVIENLALALASRDPELIIRVRLHPGDTLHAHEFMQRLGRLSNVEIALPDTEPFASGKPLAAASLQSAGVLDTLAAYVPSFYLLGDSQALAPKWVPQEMLVNVDAFAALLGRMHAQPDLGSSVWQDQVRSLGSRIKIPFDAATVRTALH